MHTSILSFVVATFLLAVRATGTVTITIDRLDSSDGGAQPPPNIVVVDVLVDLSADDVWTTAGFAANALDGARLVYAFDPPEPNIPYWRPRLANPGVLNRFVCCASKPSPRDSDQRFTAAGTEVGPHMCYAGGPLPYATPVHVDLSWWTTSPPTAGSPSVDGAIMRVAIDVSGNCNGAQAQIFPWNQAPVGYLPVLESVCNLSENGTYVGTWRDPTWVGIRWGLYVPGPAPCLGDFTCDGHVDIADLDILLASFGTCSYTPGYQPNADLNASGCVDLRDLTLLLARFGRDCP